MAEELTLQSSLGASFEKYVQASDLSLSYMAGVLDGTVDDLNMTLGNGHGRHTAPKKKPKKPQH